MKCSLCARLLLAAAMLYGCQSKSSETTEKTQAGTAAKAAVAKPVGEKKQATTTRDFLIVPGKQVGPIRPTTSEADLLQLLGPSVVTAGDTLYGPEGAEFMGTTLYKGTADEVQISYSDDRRTKPETVIVRPKRFDDEGNPLINLPPTRWATFDGLRIGTTLKELEVRNGKPFKVWGFEWDYGGMVSNWQGGKLARSDKKSFLSIALAAPTTRTSAQEKAYTRLMGDSEFLSSSEAMHVLNPTVQGMQVSLGK